MLREEHKSKTGWIVLIVIVVLILISVAVVVGGYNKAVRYDESVQEKWDQVLALYEDVDTKELGFGEKPNLIYTLVQVDREEEARSLFEESRAEAEKDSMFAYLTNAAFAVGDTAASLAYLKKLEMEDPPPVITLIKVHAMHGHVDEAFAYLEEAYEKKINWVTRLGVYPKYDPDWAMLAEDPRYEALMKKIGIRG